jgi:hypothetical protein
MTSESAHKGTRQGEQSPTAIGPLFWVAVVVAVILIGAYLTLVFFSTKSLTTVRTTQRGTI